MHGTEASGLAALDAKYSTERKLLNQVKNRYFDKNGNLKTSALSNVANLLLNQQ